MLPISAYSISNVDCRTTGQDALWLSCAVPVTDVVLTEMHGCPAAYAWHM